jgi:hypothetical protein
MRYTNAAVVVLNSSTGSALGLVLTFRSALVQLIFSKFSSKIFSLQLIFP